MDYKEPKKRVTKNDKKHKKGVYTSKHIRNVLKQKERQQVNTNGSLHATQQPLLPNGRLRVWRRQTLRFHW